MEIYMVIDLSKYPSLYKALLKRAAAEDGFNALDRDYEARQQRMAGFQNSPFMSKTWQKGFNSPQLGATPATRTPGQPVSNNLKPWVNALNQGMSPKSEPALVAPKAFANKGNDAWGSAVSKFKGLGNTGFGSLSEAIAARNKATKGTEGYNKIQGVINQAYGKATPAPTQMAAKGSPQNPINLGTTNIVANKPKPPAPTPFASAAKTFGVVVDPSTGKPIG
jgi:hypothetical protein